MKCPICGVMALHITDHECEPMMATEELIARRSAAACSAVRELMLALEYLRYACEHAEGKNAKERKMLSRAMSVGIKVGAKHKALLDDFQRDTYWEDVWAIPAEFGLPNAKRLASADENLTNQKETL